MSYSFGNVAKDSLLTNLSTNRSVSELSVTETAIIDANSIASYGLISSINLKSKKTTNKIINTFE